MSRAGKIARRTFLIGSVAIAGGVAFGVYAARKPFANPNLDDLPEGSASFNPWVIVDSEKVTLIATHADKGQGVFSAQAALIAEELDIDLDQVEVSFGMPDKAYYNRATIDPMAGYPMYDNSPTGRARPRFSGRDRQAGPADHGHRRVLCHAGCL